MAITSVSYLIFVGVSLIIYLHIPKKYQWYVLLVDSLVFYFLNAKAYTFIYLLTSVLTVYVATCFFVKNSDEGKKRIVLVITLIINIGLLAFLKYTNLFIITWNYFTKGNVSTVEWCASLAISYYTLQIVAYLLDCYWGVTERESNPLKLLLFTSFFPLMVSGPISKHSLLAPQLFEEHRFDYNIVTNGMRRVSWGFVKKLIVANRLSVITSFMFERLDIYSGLWVIVASIIYLIEIYFDFSGCMDIVIGVSKGFGIELEENFKAPLMSRTVQEFWQRWHITLGGWLKSYVMYPLLKTKALINLGVRCKNRLGKQGKKIPSYIAMLAVWILMGLWHGNSWKYIIGVGLWFWLVIVLGQICEPISRKIKRFLHINENNGLWKGFQICRTVIIVSIGMISFKATSLTSAAYMMTKIFDKTYIVMPLKKLWYQYASCIGGKTDLLLLFIVILVQVYVEIKTYKNQSAQDTLTKFPTIIRWLLYYVLLYLIIFEECTLQNSFIYCGF